MKKSKWQIELDKKIEAQNKRIMSYLTIKFWRVII